MCKKIFVTLFLLLTLSVSAAFAESENASTIVAIGEGEVVALPDMAKVVLSVKTQAGTAKEAQEANAKLANRVIAAVKKFNITSENIKTSYYNVRPMYDNKTRKINGYAADNSVTVKIKGAERAGDVIDAAIDAGANQVSSIQFYKSDTAALENDALTLAVKSAREQANVVARALGVNIVGIRKASPNVSHRARESSLMLTKAAANDRTPVEAGEVSVTASVTVEFIVK